MLFHVKRINVTGFLSELDTPIEVIVQCMTSHGFEPNMEALNDLSNFKYRKKCIDKINNCTELAIKDVRKAARYININTTFSSEDNVLTAIKHLYEWESLRFDDDRSDLSNLMKQNYGPITNDNLTSLDCTILYRLCKQRRIKTDVKMTTSDMHRLLFMEIQFPLRTIQDYLIDKIRVMTSSDIINNLMFILPENNQGFSKEEMMKRYISRRDDPLTDPLKLNLPSTDHEAILMAAKNYRIDIYDSKYPLMEYAILYKHGPNDRSFPIDSNLQDKCQRDPYSLRLDQRFNPQLPELVYRQEDLVKMATEEGWDLESNVNCYDFLKSSYNEPTFFAYGKGPMSGVTPINQTLLIECDNVSDQDPLNMVLYGTRKNKADLYALSWGELIMTFDNYREFRNPTSNSNRYIFEPYTIRKLTLLAKKPCIDQNIADRRKRLVMIIDKINLETQSKLKHLNNILTVLETNNESKIQMINSFEYLYRMSLTMRSLNDTDQFPETGEGGSLDYETTQYNVTMASINLHEYTESCSSWVRDTFLSLPLIIYYPRENKFSTGESNYEGHTIGGRLKIVHSGENTSAISSCLRLSSNWFLSTIYYYQSYFKFPVRLDITKLKHIG